MRADVSLVPRFILVEFSTELARTYSTTDATALWAKLFKAKLKNSLWSCFKSFYCYHNIVVLSKIN